MIKVWREISHFHVHFHTYNSNNDLNIDSTIAFVKYMRIKLQPTATINHKVVVLAGAFNIRNIRSRGLFPAIREEGEHCFGSFLLQAMFLSLQVFVFKGQNMKLTVKMLFTCILRCDAAPGCD